MLLDTKCVGSINNYTSMLRGDDGFDDASQIVDIWQGFYAENNVIEGSLSGGGLVGRLYNYSDMSEMLFVFRHGAHLTMSGFKSFIAEAY
jgi:hypothetical protein